MGNKLVAGAGKRGRRRKVQWAGLVFVSPLLAGLLFVFLQMMVSGVRFAFSDVSVQNGLQFTLAWKTFIMPCGWTPTLSSIWRRTCGRW